MKILLSTTTMFLVVSICSAIGMEYGRITFDDGKVIITMHGPIKNGDYEKFRTYLTLLPKSAPIVAFGLDSPGGSVLEAVEMARLIKSSHLTTVVAGGGECNSACFFLFAAGDSSIASDKAFIGIHSAYESVTGESSFAKSVTIDIVRFLSEELSVPDAIIGKLVRTGADTVTRLTESDLRDMRVKVVHDNIASLPNPSPPPSTLPTNLNPPTSSSTGPSTTSFPVCGRTVSYTINQQSGPYAEFLGVWTGQWNNASKLCAGLIVERIARDTAEGIYVYGPSQPQSKLPWKQQRITAFLTGRDLTFKDDEGSTFTFHLDQNRWLQADFHGRSGKLSGVFQSVSSSSLTSPKQ